VAYCSVVITRLGSAKSILMEGLGARLLRGAGEAPGMRRMANYFMRRSDLVPRYEKLGWFDTIEVRHRMHS
jgi:hypothetical protein